MELCLIVDRACNLRCEYCYAVDKHSAPMSVDIMRRAVDWALKQDTGWLSVTLFGGEPLLRPQVLESVERAVSEAVANVGTELVPRWLVDTNGTLIDDAIVKWLQSKSSAKVFVSLDGIAAAHNRHRVDAAGQPTHARVLQGIELLRAHRVPFDVVSVITPGTVEHLSDSLDFLIDLHAERITFQVDLRAGWSDPALVNFTKEARAAAHRWAQEFRKGNSPIIEPFHSKILSHLLRGLPLPGRCQIATREVAVSPAGHLYPCAEMAVVEHNENLSIGNVWSGLDAELVTRLRVQTAGVSALCAACALSDRCSNGCGCRQLASSGKLGAVNAALCDTESAWIEAVDEAAANLVAEGCEAFRQFYYERPWGVPLPAMEPTLVQIRPKRR